MPPQDKGVKHANTVDKFAVSEEDWDKVTFDNPEYLCILYANRVNRCGLLIAKLISTSCAKRYQLSRAILRVVSSW